MRIDRIEIRHLRLPLVTPFETSLGVMTQKDAVIVTVYSDGLLGWGEVAAWSDPWYSYETVHTSVYVLREYLAPLALDAPDLTPPLERTLQRVRGYPMAKAALETAAVDVAAQAEGKSLAAWLGGHRPTVAVGISLGIDVSVKQLLQRVERGLADGYQRIKIKIRPGWDIEVVKTIRQALGDDVPLSVDANGSYLPEDHDVFLALDDYRLAVIEQPLNHDDLEQHAKLQAKLDTPICLDESLKSLRDVRHALELDSCRAVNIKAGRVGGLLESKAVHDLCAANDVPVFCGGMLETGIGRAANVALATLPNFTMASDLSASARYFAQDIIDPPFVLGPEGTLAVPGKAGLGVDVDQAALDYYTLQRDVVTR